MIFLFQYVICEIMDSECLDSRFVNSKCEDELKKCFKSRKGPDTVRSLWAGRGANTSKGKLSNLKRME